MKQIISLLFVVLLTCAVTLTAQEKREMKKTMTVKGEVVDVACYLSNGARGEGHVACARACAKMGGALGILTADGKLHVSLLPDDHKANPNAILMDHIGHTIEATGVARSRGGVNGLMITSVAMAK